MPANYTLMFNNNKIKIRLFGFSFKIKHSIILFKILIQNIVNLSLVQGEMNKVQHCLNHHKHFFAKVASKLPTHTFTKVKWRLRYSTQKQMIPQAYQTIRKLDSGTYIVIFLEGCKLINDFQFGRQATYCQVCSLALTRSFCHF